MRWRSHEGSFIDDKGREFHSDLLFRTRFRDGRPVFLYCLIEHKSSPDYFVAAQLLRYLANLVDGFVRELRPGRRGRPRTRLPPIVALVVYHGRRRWTAPLHFQGIIDMPAEASSEVLDFPYRLLDLGAVKDEALSRDAELRAGLVALKYGTRVTQQAVGLLKVIWALAHAPDRIRPAVFWYLARTYTQVDQESFKRAIHAAAPGQEDAMMGKWARELMTRGKAEALIQLLAKRFGSIDEECRARVTDASEPELDRWLDRVLDAPDLAAVFNPRTGSPARGGRRASPK